MPEGQAAAACPLQASPTGSRDNSLDRRVHGRSHSALDVVAASGARGVPTEDGPGAMASGAYARLRAGSDPVTERLRNWWFWCPGLARGRGQVKQMPSPLVAAGFNAEV